MRTIFRAALIASAAPVLLVSTTLHGAGVAMLFLADALEGRAD